MWNAWYFCLILTKFGVSWQIFVEVPNIGFIEIHPSDTDGWKGRHDKSNMHFLQLCRCASNEWMDSGFNPSSVPMHLGLFNRPKRKCKFGVVMLHCMAQDEDFMDKFIFSDEATFQLNNKVNRCNIYARTVEFPKHCLSSTFFMPWVSTEPMHHSFLGRLCWMLCHVWTCSNISLFPSFSRTVTTHFLTEQYSTLLPGNDIISQWHISQVAQAKCTWYHLAFLFTVYYVHWFLFMVLHWGLSVLCTTAVIQNNIIAGD